MVNELWIYPPTDDPDELLRQADYRFSVRQIRAPRAGTGSPGPDVGESR
ncbi:hypothetical protein [Nocardia brevicatena]|nr:hypothetical protein [Nocardia brevicatena]